eukprot:COSAG04_NODE_5686_length_1526_cov_2.276104_3_plen_193_part_00
MQRDPRWGRNQEVPGEDPELTGQCTLANRQSLPHRKDRTLTPSFFVLSDAANFVQGLQGSAVPEYPEGVDPTGKTMIVACCKHFVANSLESWNGHTRHNFDAKVPLDALSDYYLPAFKGCVMEGKVKGIMCSYNAVNGGKKPTTNATLFPAGDLFARVNFFRPPSPQLELTQKRCLRSADVREFQVPERDPP